MNIQPWSSAITEPQAAKDPIDQVEETDQRIVHLALSENVGYIPNEIAI